MYKGKMQTPQERGKRAEERFFVAWSNPNEFPSWMTLVVRPTRLEDLHEKTDALILRSSGKPIKIQIKSYTLKQEDVIKLIRYGVVPLTISYGDSLVKIRKNTIIAINLFNNITEKSATNETIKDRKKPKIYFRFTTSFIYSKK